ncbi:OmpH family outer membrane protein [Synergistaceae bacterium OttesenSCG-928-D05]|nr:OmpH family outer membrane protein [Synergistaceae bacterium OttesenSCG-928-D05]
MVQVKKMTKIFLLVFAISVFAAGTAFAQDVIGCIDMDKIMFQHPKMEQTLQQVKAAVEAKENEMRAAVEKEPDDRKKQEIFNAKRMEAANEERRLMEPLLKDADLAIRTVANAKKITVVVDKGAVLFGGLDITEDVILELKKKG